MIDTVFRKFKLDKFGNFVECFFTLRNVSEYQAEQINGLKEDIRRRKASKNSKRKNRKENTVKAPRAKRQKL